MIWPAPRRDYRTRSIRRGAGDVPQTQRPKLWHYLASDLTPSIPVAIWPDQGDVPLKDASQLDPLQQPVALVSEDFNDSMAVRFSITYGPTYADGMLAMYWPSMSTVSPFTLAGVAKRWAEWEAEDWLYILDLYNSSSATEEVFVGYGQSVFGGSGWFVWSNTEVYFFAPPEVMTCAWAITYQEDGTAEFTWSEDWGATQTATFVFSATYEFDELWLGGGAVIDSGGTPALAFDTPDMRVWNYALDVTQRAAVIDEYRAQYASPSLSEGA